MTPTSPATEANSYMLLHGTASTAIARTATEPACTNAPSTVKAKENRPIRSATEPRSLDAGCPGAASLTGGPPAPTSSRAGAAAGSVAAIRPRLPKEYSATKPTMATE